MVATPLTGSADERLEAVLADYLRADEIGRAPDRMELIASHPDLAPELAAFFAGQDRFARMAAPLREAVSVGRSSTAEAKLAEGGRLGDFRLLREIGRGGMGIVYEAEQISLNRRVALKVLPFAATLDQRQLQRFKHEAQAAACLQHQNIVPVYYVGSDRGVHHYAMQYVEGQSLAAIIEDLRRENGKKAPRVSKIIEQTQDYLPPAAEQSTPAAGEAIHSTEFSASSAPLTAPIAGLSTSRSIHARAFFSTVAGLGIQAAEALEHAHQMGIVHRDIKPANLLVDGRGNLWITDFGLAQFNTDAGLTRTGDVVGTLRYMSPEQAMGQHVVLDHRTDIYSLGVTLYELLTLEPAFPGSDRHELLRQIGFEDPRPPRTLASAIPVELETIILKAIAKTPGERYGTARELADDLRRYLDDKPILARRPTLLQRGRKWLRRHPSFLVTGVVLSVLLAAGGLASAWIIRGEQEKTRLALVAERQRAKEAEDRFQLARRAVDEMIQLAEVDLADKPHMEGLRKRMLSAALVYYQEFIEQRRDDPDALAELAATQTRVKQIVDDLAVLQGAGQLFMLNNKAVLTDLGANDAQREKIEGLLKEQRNRWNRSFGTFHKLKPDERDKQSLETARNNETAIAAILSQKQIGRLRQIALQLRGPMAFRDAEVAKELNLTAKQKVEIRSIEADTLFVRFERSFGRPDPGAPALSPEDAEKDRQKQATERMRRMQEASQKIQTTVLTPVQTRKWKEMAGEPFEGPAMPFMFFLGPPGGPGADAVPRLKGGAPSPRDDVKP